MRTKLQTEEPDIGFGDLGRRLGEMWHSLKEEEKEDYRFRCGKFLINHVGITSIVSVALKSLELKSLALIQ